MALSGNIYGTTANQYIQPRITWSATQNIANNTSTITASLYYTRTNSSSDKTMGSWRGSITIDGETFNSGYNRITITNSGYVLAYSVSKTITHNNDGNRTCSISATGHISGTSLTSTSISGTITLDRIPRNATIDSAPNFTDEQNPTITYTNRAGTAVSSLQACLSFSGDIDIPYRDISKTGNTYTFELTDEERDIIRAKYNNTTSGPIRFYIKTVIGGYTYYSNIQKTVSIVNAEPTAAIMISDNNAQTTELTGSTTKIVRYHSDVSVSMMASAKKKATISSYKITNGARSINKASGKFNDCEVGDFNFTATDSRGLEVSNSVSLEVIPYVNLSCNTKVGMPTTDGKVSVEISGNYFAGSFGATSNNLSVYYRYKENDGSYGGWVEMPKIISGNTYSATVELNDLNYLSSYTFQAMAQDKLMAVLSAERTVKTTPVFDWSKEDFKFNVPVSFVGDVINTATVYGLTSEGTRIAAIQTCDSSNSLTLGKGGYDNYLGATNIYGNKINLNSREGVFVNGVELGANDKLLQIERLLTEEYPLTATWTLGGNFTAFNGSFALVGNNLWGTFDATRYEQSSYNGYYGELIATVTIDHGGKIQTMKPVVFGSGNGNYQVNFETTRINYISDTQLSFQVIFIKNNYGTQDMKGSFCMPFTANLSGYGG